MPEAASDLEARLMRTLTRMDQDLPTIPAVLSQIMRLTASDTSSFKDLTRVLDQDQALTARILRVANSAYYGLRDKVTTLDRALLVLGFDMVRSLATSASFIHFFSPQSQHQGFALDQFWVHAAAVGVFTDLLAQEYQAADPGDAFTAGILHDIGKLVMLVYHDQEFSQVLKRVAGEELDFYEAEMAELGVSHDFVAGLVLRNWYIPETLAGAVQHHHRPLMAEENVDFAVCVYLADFAARFLKIGASGSRHLKPPDREVLARLEIKPADLKSLLKRLTREKDRIWSLVSALD